MTRVAAAILGVAVVGAAAAWLLATSTALLVAVASLPIVGITLRGVRRSGPRVTHAVGAAWSEFHRELDRSRRFERALSLVRLSPLLRDSRTDEPYSLLAAVRSHLRMIDGAWIDDGFVYVLLPETNAAGAAVFLDRFLSHSPQIHATCAVVTFPDDGVTAAALIAGLNRVSEPIRDVSAVGVPVVVLAPHPVSIAAEEQRHDGSR